MVGLKARAKDRHEIYRVPKIELSNPLSWIFEMENFLFGTFRTVIHVYKRIQPYREKELGDVFCYCLRLVMVLLVAPKLRVKSVFSALRTLCGGIYPYLH